MAGGPTEGTSISGQTMSDVTEKLDRDLSRRELVAVVSLLDSVWPNEGKTLAQLVELSRRARRYYRVSFRGSRRPSVRHLVWQGGELVAHALSFERPVTSAAGDLPVMALSAVCVSPGHRGRGHGVAVARSAFRRVERGEFPLSLFQTPIPEFYEKLGSRNVANRFVDSRNKADPEKNPWRDPWVMIHPGDSVWPGGLIDLNGPGY